MNISAKFKSALLVLLTVSVLVPFSYGDEANIYEEIDSPQYTHSENQLHNINHLNKELERIQFYNKNIKTQSKLYKENESSEELVATLEKHEAEAEKAAQLLNNKN